MNRFLVGVGLIAFGAMVGRGYEHCLCALLGHGAPERVQKGGRWLHRCARCGDPADLGMVDRYRKAQGQ